MVYITGDLHGDISRFKSREFKRLRKKDTLIVCGDFGFIWDGSKNENKILKWIGKRRYNVLFIDGVHDNLSLIHEYPVTDWNGGKVREISGKLKHICRGSILDIDDQKIFTFGGGDNINMFDSEFHSDWIDKQLPCKEEIDFAKKNLKKANYKVDYIVTHQGSQKLKKLMTMKENETSVLDLFLDEVRDKCEYKGWFFGNYHKDKVIPPSEMAIFEAVIPLNETFSGSVERFHKKLKKRLKK